MSEDFDITKHISVLLIQLDDGRVEARTRGLFDGFNHLDLLAYCEQSQVQQYTTLLYEIADYIVKEKVTIDPGDSGSFGNEPRQKVIFSIANDVRQSDRIRLLVEDLHNSEADTEADHVGPRLSRSFPAVDDKKLQVSGSTETDKSAPAFTKWLEYFELFQMLPANTDLFESEYLLMSEEDRNALWTGVSTISGNTLGMNFEVRRIQDRMYSLNEYLSYRLFKTDSDIEDFQNSLESILNESVPNHMELFNHFRNTNPLEVLHYLLDTIEHLHYYDLVGQDMKYSALGETSKIPGEADYIRLFPRVDKMRYRMSINPDESREELHRKAEKARTLIVDNAKVLQDFINKN